MSARNVVTHNMKVINFRQQVIFQNLRCTEQEIYHGFCTRCGYTECINRRQMPDGISSISLWELEKLQRININRVTAFIYSTNAFQAPPSFLRSFCDTAANIK